MRGQYSAGRVYWNRQGGRERGKTSDKVLNLLLLPVHPLAPFSVAKGLRHAVHRLTPSSVPRSGSGLDPVLLVFAMH